MALKLHPTIGIAQTVDNYPYSTQTDSTMETITDIKTLQFLLAVVEAGSMSAAARRLGTTRSYISRRIKSLEQQIQAQLFRRTTRQLEPTQIGWALHAHAVRISRELQALQATVEDLGQSLRGHIRVSMPTALGQMVIGPWLLEFGQRHPDVSLQVIFSNRITDLMAEEVDIAIRITSYPPESVVARDLGPIDWVLCAAPDYLQRQGRPNTPEQLSQHPFLTAPLSGSRLTLRLSSQAQRLDLTVTSRLQSAEVLFLKRAAISGLGCALLPAYAVSDALHDHRLDVLLDEYQIRVDDWGDRLYLITAPTLYPTPAARALIEFLRERLGSLDWSEPWP
ncbi:LysR family transcriptional regulator [Pseudomonas sp. WN033]|nr:LysR family transcriptional regulator [Pseudomonas sp. WN033]